MFPFLDTDKAFSTLVGRCLDWSTLDFPFVGLKNLIDEDGCMSGSLARPGNATIFAAEIAIRGS